MVVSAEKARERAEARRLRILAKANERLDVVSGLVPSNEVKVRTTDSPTADGAAGAAGIAGANVVGDGDSPRANIVSEDDAVEGRQLGSDEKENKGSKRMAAMRRRRAQQRAVVVREEEKEPAANAADEKEEKVQRDVVAANESGQIKEMEAKDKPGEAADNKHVDKVADETAPPKSDDIKPIIQTNVESTKDEPIPSPPKDETSPSSTEQPKKKSYLGVAKTRRRILKEQKAQRLQSITDSEALSSSDARLERELVAEMAVMGITAKMVREGVDVVGDVDASTLGSGRKKKRGWMSLPLPILSRIMTLICLFGTGLKLGMETHSLGVLEETTSVTTTTTAATRSLLLERIPRVESTLTKPWEYGMGGKIAYMIGSLPTAPPTSLPTGYYSDNVEACEAASPYENTNEVCKSPKTKKQKEKQNANINNNVLKQHVNINMVDMEDEFDTGRARPRGVTSEEYHDKQQQNQPPPNIDPLFRTDLDDLLSKSALPFPIHIAAKFAVGFHRMWVYYLITAPMSILKSIPKTMLGWTRYPPIILIFTLLIRGANKVLLGGKSLEDEKKELGNKGNNFDVMKKVMDTAKNYIEGSFPWLVFVLGTLYDVVKVDMYVVFCGLLVGLVMPLHCGWSLVGGVVLGDGEL